jgi:hypothetical protein
MNRHDDASAIIFVSPYSTVRVTGAPDVRRPYISRSLGVYSHIGFYCFILKGSDDSV